MFKNNRILTLILAASLLILAGCSYRYPIQQGTIITDSDIQYIHRGMPRYAIERRLGKPVLINLYKDGRLVYVYTLKPNRRPLQKRQLFIYFRNGKVANYRVFSSPNLKMPR